MENFPEKKKNEDNVQEKTPNNMVDEIIEEIHEEINNKTISSEDHTLLNEDEIIPDQEVDSEKNLELEFLSQQDENSIVNSLESTVLEENSEHIENPDQIGQANVVSDQPIIEEIKLENVPENWGAHVFKLEADIGFTKIDDSLITKILEKSRDLNPIIQKIFEQLITNCENNFNFGQNKVELEDYKAFFTEINRIIPKLEKKIITEDCYSSVFFIGDTHGAIQESYQLVKFMYKILQKDSKLKFIFVGDYVDRNPWDLENLALLTAFYVLYPNNIVLLRGNHEDRTINTHYGFIDNLLRNFWDEANDLYEIIIKYFQRLPLAHISQMYNKDNQLMARVFTVHGGIPINQRNFMEPLNLEKIESDLICEVDRSDLMDPYAVSMLWSDPNDMIQGIVTDNEGSGRMQFGFPIFDAFLKENRINLVVRGHQKWNDGHRIFFNGLLYSIFSTARYDNKIKFDPKILKLKLGDPPKIIKIAENVLEEEYQQYN